MKLQYTKDSKGNLILKWVYRGETLVWIVRFKFVTRRGNKKVPGS